MERDLRKSVTLTCADCGATQRVPSLPPGGTAFCHRCARELARRTRTGLDLTLACALGMLILLPPGLFMPLMDSTIRHLVFGESRLVSSVSVIYTQVWFPFAFGFFFFAFLFPWLRALMQLVVLGSIRFGLPLRPAGLLFRWSEELRLWSLTEVVVIAGYVAYMRASIPAEVSVRAGAWCYLVAAAFAVLGDRGLDRRGVWDAILPEHAGVVPAGRVSCDVCEMAGAGRAGDRCPRCWKHLGRDIAPRFAPALAAVAAAIPLAIPAYSAAIMVNDQVTGVLEHTVLGTVQLLADRGYPSFGVVMLLAAVGIPIVEVAGMTWLLVRVRFPSREGLVLRTRIYRMLHSLVRWPMAIPFITAIAAPIVKFRGLDDIVAGPGATPLFAVVALLMAAVRIFEPRLMWKAAGVRA